MKTLQLLLFLIALLLVNACSVPTRFAQSQAPLPSGLAGNDFGFAYLSSIDTSDFRISTFSLGIQIQKTEKLGFNFGFINGIDPYLGFDYQLADIKGIVLKSGASFGGMDGSLAIPLKATYPITESLNYELSLRYAVTLYSRSYRNIINDSFLFSFNKSMLAPWYFGGDTGFNIDAFKGNYLGIRIGHYWYRNVIDHKVNRLLVFGMNVLLSYNPERRGGLIFRRFW